MNVFGRCVLRVLPLTMFMWLIVSSASSVAQTTGLDTYRHTYDPLHGYVPIASPYGYGYGYGLGNYSGGGTVAAGAGVAAAGLGQEAAGVGQMHLSNAQAAGAFEQAKTQYLQNKGLSMQIAQENVTRREQEDDAFQARDKAQVQAQLALYKKSMEQMSAAHRLTAEQFNMERGVLHWPMVLRSPEYTELRTKIDKLYDARTPEDSGENSSGYSGIVEACLAMQNLIKEDVRKGMPVTDYVTATHFISSIEYEAQFPVKATGSNGTQQPSVSSTPSQIPLNPASSDR